MPLTVLKEVFEPLLPSVILAFFGGIARFCLSKSHTIRQLIGGLIVASFAGAVAALLLADAPVSVNTKIAMGGMAGYMGGWLLDVIARRVVKTVERGAPLWDGVDRRGSAQASPEKDSTHGPL